MIFLPKTRIYSKTCNEFKQINLGRRNGNEWICVSCFKKIEKKYNGKNER